MRWNKWYSAGLVFLIGVVISGFWIRLQWVEPSLTLFNPRFLIHAHSHLAILGWGFIVLTAYLFELGMDARRISSGLTNSLFGLLVAISLSMTIAFAMQGYAMWSILFSTLFILVSWFWAGLYFYYERINLQPVVRNFYNAAVLWMVVSSLGPFMLSMETRLTDFWMDTAINYYLHLQFNGWFLFLLAGAAYHRFILRHYRGRPPWGMMPFYLMFAGLLPSLAAMLDPALLHSGVLVAGSVGTVAFCAGSVLVLELVRRGIKRQGFTGRSMLLWSGWLALLVKTGIQMLTIFPSWAETFITHPQIRIGFLHLMLLAGVSSLLLYMIARRRNHSLDTWTARTGSLLFTAGVWFMAGLLFMPALFITTGWQPDLALIRWLMFSGVPVVAGTLLLSWHLVRYRMPDTRPRAYRLQQPYRLGSRPY